MKSNDIENDSKLDLKKAMEDCHDQMIDLVLNELDPLPKLNIRAEDKW